MEAGGIDTMQWMAEFSPEIRGGRYGGNRLCAGYAHPDAFIERLCLLALEIVREPQGASELELRNRLCCLRI